MGTIVINGNINFEQGINEWKLDKFIPASELTTREKDALCKELCQVVKILDNHLVNMLNNELAKKSLSKYVTIEKITLHTCGTVFHLYAHTKMSRETILKKLLNTQWIQKKIHSTITSTLKKKNLPVEIKDFHFDSDK